MSEKTILVADDAAFMRMMLKDILVKNGYDVIGEEEEEEEKQSLCSNMSFSLFPFSYHYHRPHYAVFLSLWCRW